MKTNPTTLRRYFSVLPILLIGAGSMSACEPDEPVNPKTVAVHFMSPVAADTIVNQPDEPGLAPFKPSAEPE